MAANIIYFTFASVTIIWTSLAVLAEALSIEESPASLLVPVNFLGIFSCKAANCNDCSGRWFINGMNSLLHNHDPDPDFVEKGFTFLSGDGELTLIVNASEAVNNTRIYCAFEGSGFSTDYAASQEATLLVISESPLQENPILAMNATHVTATWSPPFLWPGEPIRHYVISFTYGSVANDYHMNSTYPYYSSGVVSFTYQLPNEILICTESTVSIAAIGRSVPGLLQSFNATSYMAANTIGFNSSAIKTRSAMFFYPDGNPALLEVYIMLPNSTICPFQYLNYTLFIEDEGGELVATYGPEQRQGSSVTVQAVTSNLTGGRNYSLKVQVGLQLQSITSNKHHFSTATFKASSQTTPPFISSDTGVVSEREDGNSSSAVFLGVMIIALIMVVVMAVGIVSLAVCMYTSRKQKRNERTCSDSKRRVFNTMVPNPIYSAEEEGPVYDSIRPQYETLVAVSPQSLTERNLGDSGEEKADTVDSVRYIDQPVHVSTLRSQSFAHTISDTSGAIPPRSFSVSNSGPPVRPMALKRNGQERNKLHLTLDLCEGEVDHSEASGLRPVSGNGSETQEESYMVMNPVQSN